MAKKESYSVTKLLVYLWHLWYRKIATDWSHMLATYLKGRSEAQLVSPTVNASYNIMGYIVLPKSYSMMILYSEMLPFSATNTILSVIPVCSLHVAMLIMIFDLGFLHHFYPDIGKFLRRHRPGMPGCSYATDPFTVKFVRATILWQYGTHGPQVSAPYSSRIKAAFHFNLGLHSYLSKTILEVLWKSDHSVAWVCTGP